MQNLLAERLIAEVMEWNRDEVVKIRPVLQAMANFGCDEYEKFWPGQRFMESLALWLSQFDKGERKVALSFVTDRLFFHTRAEMQHLVSMAFADHIRPFIIKQISAQLMVPAYSIGLISRSLEYKLALRRSLFLGLSDGAHIDIFRRTSPRLSNEQVWLTYEISQEKIDELQTKLAADLEPILGRKPTDAESRFEFIFLLDDFSASGLSYIRDDHGTIKGKLKKIDDRLAADLGRVIVEKPHLRMLLYMATESSKQYITSLLPRLKLMAGSTLDVIQLLPTSFALNVERDAEFLKIVENDKYYDPSCYDQHTAVGGTADVKLGFGNCALPLVLSHNTPNNSAFLLWSPSDTVRGLFPRVSRHKAE